MEVKEGKNCNNEVDVEVKEKLVGLGTEGSNRRNQDNDKRNGGQKGNEDGGNMDHNGDRASQRVEDDVENSGRADNTTTVTVENVVAFVRPASPLDKKTSLGTKKEEKGHVGHSNESETVTEDGNVTSRVFRNELEKITQILSKEKKLHTVEKQVEKVQAKIEGNGEHSTVGLSIAASRLVEKHGSSTTVVKSVL